MAQEADAPIKARGRAPPARAPAPEGPTRATLEQSGRHPERNRGESPPSEAALRRGAGGGGCLGTAEATTRCGNRRTRFRRNRQPPRAPIRPVVGPHLPPLARRGGDPKSKGAASP